MSCWSAEGKKGSYQYAAYAEEEKKVSFIRCGEASMVSHNYADAHTHTHTCCTQTRALYLAVFLTTGNQNQTVTAGCQAFRDRSQMHRALKGGEHAHAKSRQLRRNLEHVRHTCQGANRYTGACSAYIQT